MKEYMITRLCEGSKKFEIHKHVGGGAYIGVVIGTWEQCMEYLKEKGITDCGVGY